MENKKLENIISSLEEVGYYLDRITEILRIMTENLRKMRGEEAEDKNQPFLF